MVLLSMESFVLKTRRAAYLLVNTSLFLFLIIQKTKKLFTH